MDEEQRYREEIKFTHEEWVRANDLAVRLLEALGPRPSIGCPTCSPPEFMLPNYKMKYELAKALRDNPSVTPLGDYFQSIRQPERFLDQKGLP